MSKLTKFRQGPERFFLDAGSPLVRRVGAPLGAWIERNPLLLELLESPPDAVERRATGRWAGLVRLSAERAAVARATCLRGHGMPVVSVVVPAKNASATLGPSVASLLEQTYSSLEVILVDDGSVDDTWRVMQALAGSDTRVRALPNVCEPGAAGARNSGMAAACGPYIAFQDADDHSSPDRIERQLAALLEDPSAAVSVCNYRRVDADGMKVVINGRHFARSIISMMFHQRLLAQVGPMKIMTRGEDAEFFARLVKAGGGRVVHIERLLYLAQFRHDSLLFSDGLVEHLADGRVRFDRRPDDQ